MRTMTDQTLTDYAAAAATLSAETMRETMRLLTRTAQHEDDAADALPHAVIAIAKGVRWETAVHRTLQSAARDRLRAWGTVAPTAPEDMPEWQPERTTPRTTLEDCTTLTNGQRTVLGALAADGLARKGALATLGERKPLKVSVVAEALGMPRPRSASASLAMRTAACIAWATASVEMGTARTHMVPVPSTGNAPRWISAGDVMARAALAQRYTQPGRDSGAHGQAVWQEWARPTGLPQSAYRALGFMPDLYTGDVTATRPIPEDGLTDGWTVCEDDDTRMWRLFRNAAPAVRGSLATDLVATQAGQRWGATAVAYGEQETPLGLAAKRTLRAAQREDVAHAAHAVALANGQRACSRPIPAPDASLGCVMVCGCGGAKGQPLGEVERSNVTSGRDLPSLWTHPLTPCPMPALTDTGARCDCGRKRGALVPQGEVWAHRAR